MVFIWIALYGLVYSIAERCSGVISGGAWIPAVAMLLYSGALILWIWRTGRAEELGFCKPQGLSQGSWVSFLILLLLPLYNLLVSEGIDFSLSDALFLLSVSFVEETIFRGFLLRFVIKKDRFWGIILSGTVFALFHCVNFLHTAAPAYVWMQILCAFAIGISYGAVTVKHHSIFPCVGAHILTNLFGSDTQPLLVQGVGGILLWVCIGVYLCYGLWLSQKIRCSK